ncbi:hypothetical protein LCGC14_2857830, partial [marine sediment metagenome]
YYKRVFNTAAGKGDVGSFVGRMTPFWGKPTLTLDRLP